MRIIVCIIIKHNKVMSRRNCSNRVRNGMETGAANDGKAKSRSFSEFTLTLRSSSRQQLFGASYERRKVLKPLPEIGKVPHKLAPTLIDVQTELGNQRIGDPELGQGITRHSELAYTD